MYFLSILFLQLQKFLQCFNSITTFCSVSIMLLWCMVFKVFLEYYSFVSFSGYFIQHFVTLYYFCVILLFMHFTILFSYITLYILLYQCVYYHQCKYLLVSKHCSFVECSIDFLVVIFYFSISVLLFVLLLKYLVSLISVFSITL